MKAAIYLGKEHIAVGELPVPVCGPEAVAAVEHAQGVTIRF